MHVSVYARNMNGAIDYLGWEMEMGKIKSLRKDIVRTPEGKLLMRQCRTAKMRYILAMLISYGKRVSEIVALEREDIMITDLYIITSFLILKSKPKSGILKIRHKMLSRNHWTAKYIIEYVKTIPSGFMLPSYGKTGHITSRTIRNWLKNLDIDLWPHLFRHSLATMIAENGGSAFELKAFFDWDDIRTAQRYVQETEELSSKWADRPF